MKLVQCIRNAATQQTKVCNFEVDSMTNVPKSILSKTKVGLHNLPASPLCILKEKIINWFDKCESGIYRQVSHQSPIVSIKENFDDLLIPKDHISRSASDTYYVNSKHVLRTHTSAHQSSLLASKSAIGYLVTADVYRRDEIDATHYPVFHQMEGIRLFSRNLDDIKVAKVKLEKNIVGNSNINVTETELSGNNMYQSTHSSLEQDLVTIHLKKHLEGLFGHLFQRKDEKPLQMRWIQAYFPFTQPSWELEVEYRGKWLEVCGCGVIQQRILDKSGNSDKIGWAFGLGLERIAMVLFDIPDIRLFWSKDERFVSQFQPNKISKFVPFSKYPACYKDVSFWCDPKFHDNDFFQMVRDVAEDFGAQDLVESVSLIDTFVHPKTLKMSKCFRIQYRSFERTLSNEEVDELHKGIQKMVTNLWNVEIR
jgi:phenylalanyl-tRNA synthetase alpha chain